MLGAVKVMANDGIIALMDIPDCCGKSEGWQFCMQIGSNRGEVDDSAPDGVAIATQTLSTSCPSEAATTHNEGPSVTGC